MSTYTLKPTSSTSVYISGGGSGGSGTILNTSSAWTTTSNDIKPNSIHVNGDAVFNGNITWQDRDMREWFKSVESRLGMLQPNYQMEETWEELKELGDKYRTLEKKLLEQQRVFDILKKNST